MAAQLHSRLGLMASRAAAVGSSDLTLGGMASQSPSPVPGSKGGKPGSAWKKNRPHVDPGVGSCGSSRPGRSATLRQELAGPQVSRTRPQGTGRKPKGSTAFQPGSPPQRRMQGSASSCNGRPEQLLEDKLPLLSSSPLARPSRWTKSGQPKGSPPNDANFVPRAAKAGVVKAAAPADTARVTTILRKGAMVEFERDSTRTGFGVVQRPDGKAKWIVMDQHGNTYSIKPQQVTYMVSSQEDFTAADIGSFLHRLDAIQDTGLLELAWAELEPENKPMTAAELAQMMYDSSDPLECYAVYRMLAADKVYFKRRKGAATFEPRTASQVEELRVKVAAEEEVEKERRLFVNAVRGVLQKPRSQRLTAYSWQEDSVLEPRVEAVRAFALDLPSCDKKLAEESLDLLGVPKMPSSALDLLLRLGALPKHINMELLRSDVPQEFYPEVLAAAQELLANPPPDPDEAIRVDLTHLKVYTIDSEDTDEIDDGLSVEKLEDGRLRLWVHVADPARWVRAGDDLDLEARRRGTSVYLCTGKLPMFPLSLAAGPMSLRQGQRCSAMSVGALLHPDGSLAEAQIVNSHVEPSYRLTYDDVENMLGVLEKEEPELHLLAEAAKLRRSWRMAQGAVEIQIPETDLKVIEPESDEPTIVVGVTNHATEARHVVAEMMILSGEAVAEFGGQLSLPLPYRGQSEPDLPDAWELESIPKGPCTAVVLRRCMTKSETNCEVPVPHASLGLAGYVQFTSPIRRYGDMLAHYQVKAILRGEKAPFTSSQMEASVASIASKMREARRFENAAQRFWLLEYLRRQPLGTVLRALVLRFIREDDASLIGIYISELGFETIMRVTRNVKVGEEVEIVVVEADPRKDVLRLQEAELFERIHGLTLDSGMGSSTAASITINGQVPAGSSATNSPVEDSAAVATVASNGAASDDEVNLQANGASGIGQVAGADADPAGVPAGFSQEGAGSDAVATFEWTSLSTSEELSSSSSSSSSSASESDAMLDEGDASSTVLHSSSSKTLADRESRDELSGEIDEKAGG